MRCGALTRHARQGRKLTPDELWKHLLNCSICSYDALMTIRSRYINRTKYEGTFTKEIFNTAWSDILENKEEMND